MAEKLNWAEVEPTAPKVDWGDVEPKAAAPNWADVEGGSSSTAPKPAAPINLLANPAEQPLNLAYLMQGREAPPIAPSLARFQPGSIASQAESRLQAMAPQGAEETGSQILSRSMPIPEFEALRKWNLLVPDALANQVDTWQPTSAASGALKGLVETARDLQTPENAALILLLRQAPPALAEAAGAIFRAQMFEGGAQAGLASARQFMDGNAPEGARLGAQAALSLYIGGKAHGTDAWASFGESRDPNMAALKLKDLIPPNASPALREKIDILSQRPPQPAPQGQVLTPAGDVVKPNQQVSPLMEGMLDQKISSLGGDPHDPQSVADTVADVRALPRQEIKVGEVPVSQTEAKPSGKVTTTIPAEATNAAIVHEMEHVEEQHGGPVPQEGTQETAAANFVMEPPADRGLILADKLTPGLSGFSSLSADEMKTGRLPDWLSEELDRRGVVPGSLMAPIEAEQATRELASDPLLKFMPPQVRERALRGNVSPEEVRAAMAAANMAGGGGGRKPPSTIDISNFKEGPEGHWEARFPEEDPYRFAVEGKEYQTDWGGKAIPQSQFLSGLVRTLKGITNTLYEPRFGASDQALEIMGKMMGARTKQEVLSAYNSTIDVMRKSFDRLPTAEQDAFWDRVGTGEKHPEGWMNALQSFVQTTEDAYLRDINKKLSPDAQVWFRTNHVGARWRAGPEGDFVRDLFGAPRPLAGQAGFTKKASGLPFSVLKDRGYVPEYQNYVDAFNARMMEKVKFDSALDAIRTGIDRGMIVKADQAPIGFAPLDDKLYAIREYLAKRPEPYEVKIAPTAGAVAEPGAVPELPTGQKLFAEENFARLLNNVVSYDHIRANGALGPLLTAKFLSTGWELAFAGPHAWHVGGLLAPMMRIGNGIAAAWNGGIRGEGVGEGVKARAEAGLKGIGEALTGMVPLYPSAHYSQLGGKIVQIIANKDQFIKTGAGEEILKTYPQFERIVNGIFENGAKALWDETQTADMVKRIQSYWESNENGRMIAATLGLASDTFSRMTLTQALFRQIRSAKLGVAFETAAHDMISHADDLATGKISESELYRRAWDYADNVMGQVDYTRTWYMDRTARSALQFAFRAPAFTMGFMKFVGSALHGQWKEIQDVHDYINGIREPASPRSYIPRIDPRFAGLMAMAIPQAFAATMYQMLKTGQPPNEPLDFFYPKNGQIDSRGNPGRTSIFGFPKELYNWTTGIGALAHGDVSPLANQFKNKFAGWISKANEVSHNRDYYGTQIWEPNDPAYQQVIKGAAHIIGNPIVLAAINEAQRRNLPPEDMVLTGVGWRPAPLSLTNSRLDDYVDETLRGHRREGGMTPEQYNERAQVWEATDKLRNAKSEPTKTKIFQEMVDAGMGDKVITRAAATAMAPDAKQARYDMMSWEELGRGWDLASDNERLKMLPILIKKLGDAKPQMANFPKTAQQHFNEVSAKIGVPTQR